MQDASVGNALNKSYSELNAPKFNSFISQPVWVGFINFGDFLEQSQKRLKSVEIRRCNEINSWITEQCYQCKYSKQ